MSGYLTGRRIGLALMTVVRYTLGLGMLPYAVSKLERLQFQVSAWNYAQPLGQTSGRILLWATMGYSPKLQMFLGLLEFIPAILLLIRRTRRVGALLMLPVVANVYVLNIGLDLWPATKVISGLFLLMNLFLIAYDLRVYRRFFGELLAAPEPCTHNGLRLAGQISAWVVPVALIGFFLATAERQMHAMQHSMEAFIGERQINRAGTWKIVRLRVDDREVALPGDEGLLYFDFSSRVARFTNGQPEIGRYTTDPTKRTLLIENLRIAGSASRISGTYLQIGNSLRVTATRDGKPIELTLERQDWGLQ